MQVVLVVLVVSLCGVQRNDAESTPDLLPMVKTLQARVEALERSQTQSSAVGFYAIFRSSSEDGNLKPIKYNEVLTNAGNGYNATTGIFSAPVGGLYVFQFSGGGSDGVIVPPGPAPVLKKNGVELRGALSDSPVVVTMETGDTAFVEVPRPRYIDDHIGFGNSFSGFLLAPM